MRIPPGYVQCLWEDVLRGGSRDFFALQGSVLIAYCPCCCSFHLCSVHMEYA